MTGKEALCMSHIDALNGVAYLGVENALHRPFYSVFQFLWGPCRLHATVQSADKVNVRSTRSVGWLFLRMQ